MNATLMCQTVCLVVNTATIVNFAFFFNCTPVGLASELTYFNLTKLALDFLSLVELIGVRGPRLIQCLSVGLAVAY